MKHYEVGSVQFDGKTYFLIRRTEDTSICVFPTKYLKHKTKANCSPNTVERSARALSYFMEYMWERKLQFEAVYDLAYSRQMELFQQFLFWIKSGKHLEAPSAKTCLNATCNSYLREVFGLYQFMELEYEQFGSLKVLSDRTITYTTSVGIRKTMVCKSFTGYLKETKTKGRSIEREKIIELLDACTNCRDQLLLLLLAETGFRIGELLGVRYIEDIDYQGCRIRVQPREDNENEARAKNAEDRWAKVSKETFDILLFYYATYHELMKESQYLFIVIKGETAGSALTANAVSALLRRLTRKTGIKVTPHMLRHYFANERRKNGWALEVISKALGHKKLETTMDYINIGNEELVDATDELFRKNKALYMADKLL